jgi:hypothetical protein
MYRLLVWFSSFSQGRISEFLHWINNQTPLRCIYCTCIWKYYLSIIKKHTMWALVTRMAELSYCFSASWIVNCKNREQAHTIGQVQVVYIHFATSNIIHRTWYWQFKILRPKILFGSVSQNFSGWHAWHPCHGAWSSSLSSLLMRNICKEIWTSMLRSEGIGPALSNAEIRRHWIIFSFLACPWFGSFYGLGVACYLVSRD